MKIQMNHNTLNIHQPDGSSKTVSFDWPISQALQHGQIIIVRTEPPIGACDNRNVYGVAADGKKLWQIEPIKHSYADSPYTGLSLDSEGAVLSNWDGTNVVVDPTTGQIIRQSQGK